MKLLKYILLIIALLNISIAEIYSDEPFYYRDDNGDIRIKKDCPRDEFGNILMSQDMIVQQLLNDSSLSAKERLALVDSIHPNTSDYVESSKQLENVFKEGQASKDLSNRIIIIVTSVIVAGVYIYRRKSKK